MAANSYVEVGVEVTRDRQDLSGHDRFCFRRGSPPRGNSQISTRQIKNAYVGMK